MKQVNVLENTTDNPSRDQPELPKPEKLVDDMGDIPADALIVIPVRNMVLFPGMIVPISVGRESSVAAAQFAVKNERPIGILMQHDPEEDTPTADDLATVGTIATILRYVTTQDGMHHIICQGLQRFHVLGYQTGFTFTVATIERIVDAKVDHDKEIEARFLHLKERAIEVMELMPQVPEEMVQTVKGIDSPSTLADLVAGYMDIKPAEKQEMLEELDLRRRLDRVLDMLVHHIGIEYFARHRPPHQSPPGSA